MTVDAVWRTDQKQWKWKQWGPVRRPGQFKWMMMADGTSNEER